MLLLSNSCELLGNVLERGESRNTQMILKWEIPGSLSVCYKLWVIIAATVEFNILD